MKYFWYHASMGGELESFREWLAQGGDPNLREEGRSVLFVAAHGGNSDLVALLLEHGSDPNLVDAITGRIPLHGAADRRNVRSVELLLQAGSTIDLADRDGNTPLWCAVAPHRAPNCEIVSLLLERGASPDSRNKAGVVIREFVKEMWPSDVQRLFRTGDPS